MYDSTSPWRVSRSCPLTFSARCWPFSSISLIASSKDLAVVRAFLQSANPAPVSSRSLATSFAVNSMVNRALLNALYKPRQDVGVSGDAWLHTSSASLARFQNNQDNQGNQGNQGNQDKHELHGPYRAIHHSTTWPAYPHGT